MTCHWLVQHHTARCPCYLLFACVCCSLLLVYVYESLHRVSTAAGVCCSMLRPDRRFQSGGQVQWRRECRVSLSALLASRVLLI